MDLAEQLIALEHEGWRALVAGNGGAYFRKHLTANAVNGIRVWNPTREDALEAMEAARPWARFETRDPHVVELGHGSGVVVYSVLAWRRGDEPYAAVVSSTFVRDHDGWKLAFHQHSPPS